MLVTLESITAFAPQVAHDEQGARARTVVTVVSANELAEDIRAEGT